MTITPFLALPLRKKKDTIFARQRARRVANLLGFDAREQACIAAGSFVIACQALTFFSASRLLFQIENHQLSIFAQEAESAATADGHADAKRITGMLPDFDAKVLYRLTKTLPPREIPAEELDLGWLVESIEEVSSNRLFDEVAKQNQEVLALLHELRLYQGNLKENREKPANPHAA